MKHSPRRQYSAVFKRAFYNQKNLSVWTFQWEKCYLTPLSLILKGFPFLKNDVTVVLKIIIKIN